MRVTVVGGGIGGLALAQGLMRRDLDVVVVERDQDLARTGGYKLHLGPPACAALRTLLLPHLLETLYASAVGTSGYRIAVRDRRGRLLIRGSDGSEGTSLDVDRITLRLLLAEGLGERLLTGRRVTGVDQDSDSTVVTLADGGSRRADLVVLADGAGSRLADRLAGESTSQPTGLVGVAGRTPWREVSPAVQRLLRDDPTLAVGPGGTGMYVTAHDPVGRPAVQGQSRAFTQEPGAIWGLLTLAGTLPGRLVEIDPARLQTLCAELLRRRDWHPGLVELLEAATVESVGGFGLPAADPERIAPWPAGRITALGDAVHAMPPTGGQGAATAILDAATLVDRLDAVQRGEVTLPVSVHDHEQHMRERGAAAVHESLQPLGWIRASGTPLGGLLTRLALPAAASVRTGVDALRRR